jgi:hypothetical protein
MQIGFFAGDVDFGAAKKKAAPQQTAAKLLKQAKTYRALAAKTKNTKTKKKYQAKAEAFEAQAKAIGHVATAVVARQAAVAAATAATRPIPPPPPTAPNIRLISDKHLQAAIVTLGRTVNDKTLSAIKVDGAVGSGTAKAANRAMSKYVTQGDPAFRTGKMSVATIKGNSGTLAALIDAEIQRRGGTVVPPEVVAGAKAKAAAAAKLVGTKKLKVKTAAAVMKAATARRKARTAKAKAADLHKKALALKATNPKQAAALETQADQADTLAAEAEKETAEATSEAAKASVEESAAVTEAAVAATEETTPAAARGIAPSLTPTKEEGGAGGESPGGAPSTTAIEPIAPPSESFFAKHKIPIIAGGAIVVLGIAALALKKKKRPN